MVQFAMAATGIEAAKGRGKVQTACIPFSFTLLFLNLALWHGKPAPGQSKAKKEEPRKKKAKTSGKHVLAPAPGGLDHHRLSFYLLIWLLD